MTQEREGHQRKKQTDAPFLRFSVSSFHLARGEDVLRGRNGAGPRWVPCGVGGEGGDRNFFPKKNESSLAFLKLLVYIDG